MKKSLNHLFILLHNLNRRRKTKEKYIVYLRMVGELRHLCLVLDPAAGRESHESELSSELARLVWRISSSVSWATCTIL